MGLKAIYCTMTATNFINSVKDFAGINSLFFFRTCNVASVVVTKSQLDGKCLINNFVCVLSSHYRVDYILLHVLHCLLSNDSRAGKSDEGLMSAFKVFIFHILNIVILPHFFHLKNMLPDNLNKIYSRILTLLLAFLISVLLTSSNFTSSRISSDFI